MRRDVARAAERLWQSAIGAGAMQRLFIGVGDSVARDELCKCLNELGADVIAGELSAMQLFPGPYLRHQGAHFNTKLFLLNGLDSLFESLGDELFRRLQFQQGTFRRAATWTLLWIERFDVAAQFRRIAPELWRSADRSVLFSSPDALSDMKFEPGTARSNVTSPLGEVPIPAAIAAMPLSAVMNEEKDNSIRVWGDFLRLSPNDFFLTYMELVHERRGIPVELRAAVENLAQQLEMKIQMSGPTTVKLGLAEPPRGFRDLQNLFREMKNRGEWVGFGEVALRLADQTLGADGATEAIRCLDDLLEGERGWLQLSANLLADRPLRMRAMLYRAAGETTRAASDIDRCEENAIRSGLDAFLAKAFEARAQHVGELGDEAQARKWRNRAQTLSRQ